ncbi:MAG: hypothetical protein ACYCT1_11855 [Steroidobacteraceae bacterium]
MTRLDPNLSRSAKALLGGCVLLAVSVYAEAHAGVTPPALSAESAAARTAMAEHKGIWKWVVPPVRMNGMFDDHDPIGLVAGKLIPADCAFNWTDPDTHRLICFTTATSLEYFLGSPRTYLVAAEKNWRALKGKLSTAR